MFSFFLKLWKVQKEHIVVDTDGWDFLRTEKVGKISWSIKKLRNNR